jgi:hypothetical protein
MSNWAPTVGLLGASVPAIGIEVQPCNAITATPIKATDRNNCLSIVLFQLAVKSDSLPHRRSTNNYEAFRRYIKTNASLRN